jgi:hypothetical protein
MRYGKWSQRSLPLRSARGISRSAFHKLSTFWRPAISDLVGTLLSTNSISNDLPLVQFLETRSDVRVRDGLSRHCVPASQRHVTVEGTEFYPLTDSSCALSRQQPRPRTQKTVDNDISASGAAWRSLARVRYRSASARISTPAASVFAAPLGYKPMPVSELATFRRKSRFWGTVEDSGEGPALLEG